MTRCITLIAVFAFACASLVAQESEPADATSRPQAKSELPQAAQAHGKSWSRTIPEDADRGILRDRYQHVRGDSGKWQDDPLLIHAPPIDRKPARMPLDDWIDSILEGDHTTVRADDNWLLIRTRQLNDNDRVWVKSIERNGNAFTLVLQEAVWQGRYMKNFTGYETLGVSLGKLEPGEYEAKCIIEPLAFQQFERPSQMRDNWPKEVRAANQKPVELRVTWKVVAGP